MRRRRRPSSSKTSGNFSESVTAENLRLKQFLKSHLYENPAIVEDRERSVAALDELFLFYLAQPEKMPRGYTEQARTEPVHRVVCDYIAGMTDHYLLQQHSEQFGGSNRVVLEQAIADKLALFHRQNRENWTGEQAIALFQFWPILRCRECISGPQDWVFSEWRGVKKNINPKNNLAEKIAIS